MTSRTHTTTRRLASAAALLLASGLVDEGGAPLAAQTFPTDDPVIRAMWEETGQQGVWPRCRPPRRSSPGQ